MKVERNPRRAQAPLLDPLELRRFSHATVVSPSRNRLPMMLRPMVQWNEKFAPLKSRGMR